MLNKPPVVEMEELFMGNQTSDTPRAGYAFFLVFALMSAGIILASYLYYRNYEKNYRANVESQLSIVADLKIGELALWRKERLGDGNLLLKNKTFSSLVRRFLENPEDTDAQKQLQDWIGQYPTAYQYKEATLYDAEGSIRMFAPEAPDLVDFSISQNIAKILREGRVVFQDFHRESADGLIHLAVVVPIFDSADESRPLGVLALDLDPTTYLYPFINRWPTPSQTAETFLARRDGDDVLFLNELRFNKNAALNLRIPMTRTDLPAVKAALGQTGVVEGVDYRGVAVIAAVGAVSDSPWFLVARMDTAEVYAPLRERLWLMAAFSGFMLISSGMALGLIWKHRRARFLQERYTAAETLKRAEEKFHLYVDNISDAIWVFDSNMKVTYVSPSVFQIIGYTPDELIDKSSHDFIHPDDLSMFIDTQSRVFEHSGQPVTAQYRVIHKNGEYVSVESTGVGMTDTQTVQGAIIAMRDISRRKRAEEDLQKFFDLVPDMVCVASSDGYFMKVNPRWEETLGYTEHEILSTPFLDFIHDDDRETTIKELERQIGGEPTIMFTNRYRCKDGGYKWMEWVATPSDDKRLLFAAVRDITERKQVETNLRLAKEEAEKATKLKDKFVELVSHDLRSPFTSMMGLLKLYAERRSAVEDEDSRIILDRVFKSGDRMISMIEQLLQISRLQTGKITPDPRFFKAHMAVAGAIGLLSHNASQKGIGIINEVPQDMRLYADQSLFGEVLINLLSNAIKFCSQGDKITFSTSPGHVGAIAIQDTGKGIDEKRISNLFRYEVTTSTLGTAGELGTGLGLPFSRDIMKAHGGEITVESALGMGSVFYATLPYVKPIALVVDDDPIALMVIKEYLETRDFHVIQAVNGEQALMLVRDKRPHIIISDMVMPVMDGFTLLKRLKEDRLTRDVPVIAITGNETGMREKVINLGADDFVSKPFAMEDLGPRVRRFAG